MRRHVGVVGEPVGLLPLLVVCGPRNAAARSLRRRLGRGLTDAASSPASSSSPTTFPYTGGRARVSLLRALSPLKEILLPPCVFLSADSVASLDCLRLDAAAGAASASGAELEKARLGTPSHRAVSLAYAWWPYEGDEECSTTLKCVLRGARVISNGNAPGIQSEAGFDDRNAVLIVEWLLYYPAACARVARSKRSP